MKTMIKKFLFRLIIGILAIALVNQILSFCGYSLSVGVNLWTCLASGTLGVPGIALLYGIMAL